MLHPLTIWLHAAPSAIAERRAALRAQCDRATAARGEERECDAGARVRGHERRSRRAAVTAPARAAAPLRRQVGGRATAGSAEATPGTPAAIQSLQAHAHQCARPEAPTILDPECAAMLANAIQLRLAVAPAESI
jgi:hypothetical protein